MSFNTTETIQRLWETFLRDQLAGLEAEAWLRIGTVVLSAHSIACWNQ